MSAPLAPPVTILKTGQDARGCAIYNQQDMGRGPDGIYKGPYG
jgi:hypothetical protein